MGECTATLCVGDDAIYGFRRLYANDGKHGAARSIEELHNHFSTFDDIVTRYRLEKLKTIGDAYMCVAGLPHQTSRHAPDACNAALDIRDYMARTNIARSKLGLPCWNIRIGVHTGGVIAGVVGKQKFTYDVWGDAVNTAALMEAHAEPGTIVLSDSTFGHLHGEFETFSGVRSTPPKRESCAATS